MTSRSLELAERYRPGKSDYPPAYR